METEMEESQIAQLRSHVGSHPEDSRTMALLANLLMEQMKSSSSDTSSSGNLEQDEAIFLAKTSIKLTPEESIGYAVLSTIPKVEFVERMAFLRKAIDLEQESSAKDANYNISSRAAIATSLLRLLIEPREEMARNKDKLTAKKIMRKDLCVNSLTGYDEQKLYNELNDALDTAKSIIWKKREERWQKQQQEQGLHSWTFTSIPTNIQRLARTHYRLGTFFRTLKPQSSHRPSSRHHFQTVLELLNPPHMETSYQLKSQSLELHELESKSRFWLGTFQQEGLSATGDPESQNIMQIDRCPSEYIVSLYSSFAATFDNQLVKKLKYETPTKLRHLVDEVWNASGRKDCFHNCADLGCGTGLSGIAFHDLVKGHLSGVDLSEEMVEKAKERGCYNSLHIGDVEAILKDPPNGYDLIIACDVFVYIGNLHSIFQSVAKCLTAKDGLFAFSTELIDEHQKTVGDAGFLLQSCARYAHKESYICNLAKEFGFTVKAMKKDVIRKNGGKDVNGILTILSLEEECT